MSSRWYTGKISADIGADSYAHLVRSPDDPIRLTRKERQELHGHDAAATKWKADLKANNTNSWAGKILELLAGSDGMTFNAIVLTASGHEYTADVAYKKAPDKALWALVANGKIEHTGQVPVLFRLRNATNS